MSSSVQAEKRKIYCLQDYNITITILPDPLCEDSLDQTWLLFSQTEKKRSKIHTIPNDWTHCELSLADGIAVIAQNPAPVT